MSDKGHVFIIGAGSAGKSAGRALAGSGWRVTMAENDRAGGTCIWRGCMPKRALHHSAMAYRDVSRAESFGVLADNVRFDWQSVLAWKWHAQETYAGDQESVIAESGVELVTEAARFVSPDEVEARGETYRPDAVIIATGSVPSLPPVEGVEHADTSDDALRYPELPRSLAIVGAGYVAMEFAAVFASFGCEVTMLARSDTFLGREDPEIAAVVLRALEAEGVRLVTGASLAGFAVAEGGVKTHVTAKDGSSSGEILTERVLLATGRRPALDGLELERGGIELGDRGKLRLDSALRTTNPRVWAAGDAAGGLMHTPVAGYEGRVVAASIDSGTAVEPDYSAVPSVVFTLPTIARVGLTEAEAHAKGIACSVHRQTFEYSGAAIIDDERDGLVKLVFAEDDGRLLGGQIAGPPAPDLVYALAVAVRKGATADDLKDTLGIHPAYSELVNWAAW